MYKANNLTNPKTTAVAFDLHDVLFKKIYLEIVFYIFKALSKGLIFYFLNPFFLYKVKKISSKTIIWEDFFIKLKKKYPSLYRYDKEFYAIANAQRPIKNIINILKYLNNKGYKIYILSNIGGITLELFKKKFPNFFKYISGFYVPNNKNGYICKPNIMFYHNFKEYLQAHNSKIKNCIFIDDLEINIQGALESNLINNNCQIYDVQIHGILYTSSEVLTQKLVSFGVLDT